MFVVTMTVFCCNELEFVSMGNQECKVRPEIRNININEPWFYPYSVKISKCSGSCNNINDPYAKFCAYDVSKIVSVKVFNLNSKTNETRYIKRHETGKCKYRLDASVCNINKDGMKINADVNVKNWLTKEYVTKDLFGIQVIVNVNMINHVTLENICIIKTVSVEKG